MGGKTGTTQTTQKQELDPRIAEAFFGPNGTVTAAQALYARNPTGINPRMQQGWDTTYNFLTSPQYTQDYQGLRSVGNRLLNTRQGGGNPFSGGNPFNSAYRQNIPQSFLAQLQQPYRL